MRTIEIKNIYGDVIFKHTAKKNTVTLTVEAAISCGVSLANANLSWASLAGADLAGANLDGADLSWAHLEGANLEDANLEDANLAWAHLEDANLKGADLIGANLKGADIDRANLVGADLNGAYLYRANLKGADLRNAILNGKDLVGANIYCTNLNGAKNIPYIPLACPSEGAFTAWKKVNNEYLVKIQIPEDARRLSATSRKCRCDKAMVLDITSLDGEEHYDEVTNNNYKETVYKVGEMVYPDSFDENRWNECSTGIHFFINKEEAINY